MFIYFYFLDLQTKMNAGREKPSALDTPPASTRMDLIAVNVTVDGHYEITRARVRIAENKYKKNGWYKLSLKAYYQ